MRRRTAARPSISPSVLVSRSRGTRRPLALRLGDQPEGRSPSLNARFSSEQGFPDRVRLRRTPRSTCSSALHDQEPHLSAQTSQKKGYHVASLSNVVKWLGEKCEAAGIDILPGLRRRPDLSKATASWRAHSAIWASTRTARPRRTTSGHGHLREGHGARRSVRAAASPSSSSSASNLHGKVPASLRDGHQGDLARQAGRSTKPGRVIHGSLFPTSCRSSTACGSTT